MTYPQAPWTLQGNAISSLHINDVDRVRHLIPAELDIISIGGKTVSGVYLSYYGTGSVLEYSELIVIPAVVGYRGKIGGWVSHIYVDNADSVAGGREIWGLGKQLAEFNWEKGERVTVRQGNQMLCSLNYGKHSLAWPQYLGGNSFSTKNADLLLFVAQLNARFGFVGSQLEVPQESPFAEMGLGQPFLSVRLEEMNLQVFAPSVVAQQSAESLVIS